MWRLVNLVLAAAVLIPTLALADEGPPVRHHYRRHIYLPPERHVIEVVQPPGSGNFIINGARFTAKTDACYRWVAGDRIRLIAGDWNGQCVDAVFYNFSRRSTCEVWCRGSRWW